MFQQLLENTLFIIDRVVNSLFTYQNFGKRKRQTGPDDDFVCRSVDDCGNSSFVGVPFENLTFTDAQREFCENEETCLYDLVVTGDESIAATTKEATQNITRLLAILGECIDSYPAWCVYGIYLRVYSVYRTGRHTITCLSPSRPILPNARY